jgi:hypothetical protein
VRYQIEEDDLSQIIPVQIPVVGMPLQFPIRRFALTESYAEQYSETLCNSACQ